MPRQVQPFLRGKEQPEQQRRSNGEQVQHDRRTDRRIVRRAEKRRRGEAERGVKAADRAGRRHRHADDEQRNHQERSGKRHRR